MRKNKNIFPVNELAAHMIDLAKIYGSASPIISDLGFLIGYDIDNPGRTEYYDAIVNAIQPISTEPEIMECGCGGGGLLRHVHERGYTNISGVDYSVAGLLFAKIAAPAEYYWGDFEHINELGKKFDVIIFAQVLEHIVDDRAAISCAQDCLRDNGYILCSVPYMESEPLCYEHVRSYNEDTILRRYEKLGVVKIAWHNTNNIVFRIGID